MFDTIRDMTDEDVAAARRDLHDATRPGWFLGRPSYDERRDEWALYALDTTERPKAGRRAREWTAVAPTQARVVREMTRCDSRPEHCQQRQLSAGRRLPGVLSSGE